MRLSGSGKLILNYLYPRRCPICQEPAPAGAEVCPSCLKILPVIRGKRCAKCGKEIDDTEVFCEDCLRISHLYTQGMGAFRYDDLMRETISAYKYKGRKEYGRALGTLTYQAAAEYLKKWKPELIIPVPIHKSRMKRRGFNQAEVLARRISELSGIPMDASLMERRERTQAMKELGPEERRRNLEGVFRMREGVRLPKRVLIADDIYTTGATVDEMAAVLFASGASRVFFLTVCIGSGFMIE